MADDKKFVLDEALKFGWESMKDNIGPLLLCMGLPVVGLFILQLAIPGVLIGLMHMDDKAADGITKIVVLPFDIIVRMGMINIALKILDKKPFSFNDLLTEGSGLQFFLAFLSYMIMTAIGLLLVLAPGIWIGITFSMFDFLIVDKKAAAVDALKQSMQLTSGAKWDLFLFYLICVVIQIIGVICLGIGLIPALIVVTLARAYVYRQCLARSAATV